MAEGDLAATANPSITITMILMQTPSVADSLLQGAPPVNTPGRPGFPGYFLAY